MRNSIFLLFILVSSSILQAQDYSGLRELGNHHTKVYFSEGYQGRADSIATRVDSGMAFYKTLLGTSPQVTLLVLSANDWSKHTSMPVMGMPHYKDDSVLVVAAHDNEFWRSFIPKLDELPTEMANKIKSTYVDAEGKLTMQPFFDLLALHELGHAFHMQFDINMQRKWLSELFVNMLLHTYIAEKEKEVLPALTVFPQMVIGIGTKGFQYTSLKDVHEKYTEIGSQHPRNYGWYQCRWHAAAANIYDDEGKNAVVLLWNALKSQKKSLGDEELISYLRKQGVKGVVRMIQNWDE